MISAGNGFVEYHFSIFMMLALISFFRSIKLIAISTIIFALQHFIGFFYFPELLCGSPDYRFSLLLIHAIYLILAATANSIFIFYMNRSAQKAEAVQEETVNQFKAVIDQLQNTSSSILQVTTSLDQGAIETEQISTNIANSSDHLRQGA